jgi:N6-L-threonylcarbamoyladenine synthase
VVDTLADKTLQAARETGVRKIVVAGGVAANSLLRNRMREAVEGSGLTLFIPGLVYCVDNAAMIALTGYLHHQRGERSGLDLNPKASGGL